MKSGAGSMVGLAKRNSAPRPTTLYRWRIAVENLVSNVNCVFQVAFTFPNLAQLFVYGRVVF